MAKSPESIKATIASRKRSKKQPSSYFVGATSSKQKTQANASLDATLQSDAEGFDSSTNLGGIYLQAEILIDQIASGVMSIGTLGTQSKLILYTYLAKFSPLVSRIIRIHTKLPLSSMRLQKPNHDNDIVQDYVHSDFEKLVESEKFKSGLERIIRSFWVYGYGLGRIDDDYFASKMMELSIDLSESYENLPEIKEEDMDAADEISDKYIKDENSVSWKEKKAVLDTYLPSLNPDYRGVKRFGSLSVLDIESTSYNLDIDYFCYGVPYPEGIKQWISANSGKPNAVSIDPKLLKRHPLHKLGYSMGILKTSFECNNQREVQIDSNPFNDDGVYIVRLSVNDENPLDNSILNSVLEPAIHNMRAIKASNSLVGQSSKIDRIVSAKDASDSQLAQLNEDLATAAENEEGSLVAVNFEVSVEELSLDVRDKLDLTDQLDRTNKEILSTLGMPEELVFEGGSYGSGFLKVELLSHEYVEFRQKLKAFIEDQIFTPIAIKKGYITLDDWGNVVPLIPRVKFDRLSLARQSEDFSQIMDLVQSEKLPISLLYDLLGLESEDIEQELLKQKTSIVSDSVASMMEDAIAQLSDNLTNNPEFVTSIMRKLGISEADEDEFDLDKKEPNERF